MEPKMLLRFFFWCAVMNTGLLLIWTVVFRLVPDFIYRQQRKWFMLTQEAFDEANYRLLGTFKILVLVFNVVPLIAMYLAIKNPF